MATSASASMSGIIALTYLILLKPTAEPPESAYVPMIESRHNRCEIRRKIGNNISESLSVINILPCCNSYLLLTVRKLDGILASGIGGVNDWNSGIPVSRNTKFPPFVVEERENRRQSAPRENGAPDAYSPGRTACAPSCGHAAGAPARWMRSSSGSDSSQ